MTRYKLIWAERGHTANPHESIHPTFIGAINAATLAAAAYDVVKIEIIKIDELRF